MLNDRDDKYENPEESEYHFSDEEVNYEVETESPKATPASDVKENVLDRLSRSRRMLISLGVFLVLVFVVYKMVAPSSTTPTTDITQPIVAQNPAAPMPTTVTQVTTTQQTPPVLPVATTVNAPPPVATTTTTTAQTAPVQQLPAQAPAMQTQTTTVAQAQQPMAALPQMQVSQVALPIQTPQTQTTVTTTTPSPPEQNQMPVQQTSITTSPMAPTTTTTITQPTALTNMGSVLPANTDSRVAALATENQKLANQLQQEYAQKINDYATQNRALQDQVQTLNTRVASMETQMNQLVQALTRQVGQAQAQQAQQAQVQQERSDVKLPYNVQAIIPGRAWLRSDSGETLTVAEGDLVKDVGRVTKIDPYDGVVEINTGSKTVSLSYGNGS